MTKNPHPNNAKNGCNTKDIIITFRVTPKQWAYLLEKSGGNTSRFIRRKLGLEEQI
jgi:hypothetical protein